MTDETESVEDAESAALPASLPPAIQSAYTYVARPVRVITERVLALHFDLGFNITREHRVRLRGVEPDSYPIDAITNWLEAADTAEYEWPLIVETEREPDPDAGIARYYARVYRRTDNDCLNDHLRTL